jgi:hypothetical protein
MAVIDTIGQVASASPARDRKSLHPSCYLLGGLIGMIAAALLIDILVGLIG